MFNCILEGFGMAVREEKFWARNQRYKRYVVIPNVLISEVYCTSVHLGPVQDSASQMKRGGGGSKLRIL